MVSGHKKFLSYGESVSVFPWKDEKWAEVGKYKYNYNQRLSKMRGRIIDKFMALKPAIRNIWLTWNSH